MSSWWVRSLVSGVHEIYLIFKLIQQNQYSIAMVAPFSGLHRFPQGRGFKQWTGDDSKALMKVFLPAIEGLVPVEMVRCVHAFLEFCYLVRRDFHDTKSLEATCYNFIFLCLPYSDNPHFFLRTLDITMTSSWHHHPLHHYDLIPLHLWLHSYIITPLWHHRLNTINTRRYHSCRLTCSYLVTW